MGAHYVPKRRTSLHNSRLHEEALFEQLLLFDTVNLNITGPNIIGPLMYNFMGPRPLEALLEQNAISFVVWQPTPMMAHYDGKVTSLLTASIGDGKGSEFDIEKIVDQGLRLHPTHMSSSYQRTLKRKLVKVHSLLDPELSGSAWQIAADALKEGSLEHLGLPRREQPLGLRSSEGEILQKAATSLLDYRYLLTKGMISQNNAGIFDCLNIAVEHLRNAKSPIEKYTIISEFEEFPNLRALFGEIEKPFQRIARFRQSYTAKKFREWLSTAPDPASKVQLIREYVSACSNRRNLFEICTCKIHEAGQHDRHIAFSGCGGRCRCECGADKHSSPGDK